MITTLDTTRGLFKALESVASSPAAIILAVVAHAGFVTLELTLGRGQLISFTALALIIRLLREIGRKLEARS